MKLSCALVLTLASLVVATPVNFSVKGSGASAKAEGATFPVGQFGVVTPGASKPSGFSGSFSKASSGRYASSSASSSSSGFNYNAGQQGTASQQYSSQGLLVPIKNVAPQVVAVPQATAFATAGSNSQTGASANAQASGSYSSEKENENIPANVQYQFAVPESKPNSYVGLSSGAPSDWHEHSKPNSFDSNANDPEHSEKNKETFGVQRLSNNGQSGTAFLSTPSAPIQGSVLVENAPSYSGGFGGPPGILIPHDKISSVGTTPGYNGFLSYPSGAQLNVPNNQQSFINTPVSTVNPTYAQHDYPAGNINPTVQSINNEYVFQNEQAKPSYKPEIEPSYLEQNKPTTSNGYISATNVWQQNGGQHNFLQPHAEISHTQKEFEQATHSIDHFSSHGDKPFANNQGSKPIKNVQIFIQPLPTNAPQTTYNPVYLTNTQIRPENKKEVKPTNQAQYAGGFGAPDGILKPFGQSVSSGQTFSSSPVKIEQGDSPPVGLFTTGTKETTYNTASGGLLNEEKVTVQPWAQKPTVNSLPNKPELGVQKRPTGQYFLSTPSISSYTPEQGQGGISIDKTKPLTLSGSFGQVSEDVKPTIQPTITNNGFAYSNTPKPVVTSSTPHFETTKDKESYFVSYTTTQPTSVNSWQQSTTYTPSFEGSKPGYFDNQKTSPTQYPSLTGDYSVSKQTEQYPTVTSFAQSTYKPSIENSLATSSASRFSESPKTSPQNPSTGTFTVSKEVYKVPTQIVNNNVYPPGSTASVSHLNPNSVTPQSQSTSHQHQQSTNYGGTTSFVTQKPTIVNFAGQTPDATSGLTSGSITQQSTKPTVSSFLTSSSVSGSYVSSNVSPTQKPFYTESFSVPQESETDTSSNVDSTVGTKPVFNLNAFSGKPQTQFGASQQSVELKPTSSFVTKEPTVSTNIPSPTISSTSAISQSTTGTLTGAIKQSSYTSSSSSGYPLSSSNSWSDPSYVTGSYNKPKQTTYFNQNKPVASRLPEKKETLVPTNQPYFTSNFASNIPTTAKPSVPVTSLNVVQQSSSSISTQEEKESTATATSGSGTTYSKPTPQTISSNSGLSYTSFASPKPKNPTNQPLTSNSAFSSFGSSLSQVKPQYQFSTVQPITQKKQWYSNNYGTHESVKPHTYPGFTSSFTTFGQGSVGGLYDKTKQTQYTSTGQNKPTSSGQYNPSLTGQYKPISTGQYKPTYNRGFAGQSVFQKPSNQPTQTGGYVSTYTQTTSKPFVALSAFDKQKPTGGASVVNQKESSILSSFVSSTGVEKPTNQPSASYDALKPTSSGTSFESVTGSPPLTNVSDKGKLSASVVSTTSQYDLQKPVNPTVQTVSNTYGTSSFNSAKPTNFQTTGTPLLENKPTHSYAVQVVSSQTIAPSSDVENSKLGQSFKPTWSSSNKKESSYTSNTGVPTSVFKPTTTSVDGNDNSYYVDKTQTSQVKATSNVNFVGETTSSVSTDSIQKEFSQFASGSYSSQKPSNQFNEQIGSINQASIPLAQKNPSLPQPNKPCSTGVNYQANTEFQSHSQAQPAPTNPDFPSTFGESRVQSTSPKETSGSLESSTSDHKGSVQHVHNEHTHSKPTNTFFISPSQPQAVAGFDSSISQFPKGPGAVNFDSKPVKVPYTTQNVQAGYKPTSAVGAISGYANQQNSNPTIIPTSQENYSNVAVSGPTKPPGQYWALNTQSSEQQTALQATKPNIKVTVVGKPTGTIVSPPYSSGFGGPLGILKPNDFGISPNQGNIQSQAQVTSGSYSSGKVETNSNTASYFGGFGGSSGLFKPDEKHSVHHAEHDKPSFNGVSAGTIQDGAQASHNVAPTFPTSGGQGYIKEQTGYGDQVPTKVQGSAFPNVASAPPNAAINAAANVSGVSNSNAYASSAVAGHTDTSVNRQFEAFTKGYKNSPAYDKVSQFYLLGRR